MINRTVAAVGSIIMQFVGIMILVAGFFSLPSGGTTAVAAIIFGGALIAAATVGYNRYWHNE